MKAFPTRRALLFGIPVLAIVVLILVWSWDWFIPIVESQASAALGRKVTIAHLHVRLGRVTRVVADGVQVANPDGFPAQAPFVRIAHLGIRVNVLDYLFHQRIVIPRIDLDQPVVEALATPSGRDNYTLKLPQSGGKSSGPAPQLGSLTIEDGKVHAAIPKLKADFHLDVATKDAAGIVAQHGQGQEIAVEANGTYAGQPVTGTLIAGGLLTLQDASQPYPVDLHLANGATHVSLTGTVQDPLAFKGADLKLEFAGDDMSRLYPLTGIPIPATPRYQVAGQLDYADHRIRFKDFSGTVGNSDLEGTIAEDPGKARPDVTMDLRSKRVDLADLGGFIGTNPGGAHESGATPAQRQKVAKAEAGSSNLLPDQPINVPKISAADIHLKYHADHIEGRSMPLDQLTVALDVVDGAIDLHPVSFTVGSGKISGNISLTPVSDSKVHAKAEVDFDQVDLSHLMQATHVFHGAGSIGGRAELDATGNSIASLAGNGDGGLTLYMAGGDLSAVLVDLTGLEFGNAVVSALGLPSQTDVRCFIGDFALKNGMVDTRTLLLDTGEAIVRGKGDVNLRDQKIDYSIAAKPKHFSIGSLPAPIDITGTLKDPSIAPATGPLLERGGAALALGVLAAPLAILPTIQFGAKEPHQCAELVQEAEQQTRSGTPGGPMPASTGTGSPPQAPQAGPSSAPGPSAPAGNAAAPFHVEGKGDSAIRQLNQEELDRIGRRAP